MQYKFIMSHIYPQNINHLKLSQIKYLNLFKINNIVKNQSFKNNE